MNDVARFHAIEAQMAKDCPGFVHEARELAARTVNPLTADPYAVWNVLWDKPLYADTQVLIAHSYIGKLRPFVNGDRWWDWADPDHPVLTMDGPAHLNVSFAFGSGAPAGLDRIGVAKKCLFAVQGAARALARWSAADPHAPLRCHEGRSSGELIRGMCAELGPRWGHVTAMHFLAELGLSVRADRWLARAANWLGLVDAINTDRALPNLHEAIAIDAAVKDLVRKVDGTLSPARLRYFDKILMEAARQGIVSRQINETVAHPAKAAPAAIIPVRSTPAVRPFAPSLPRFQQQEWTVSRF